MGKRRVTAPSSSSMGISTLVVSKTERCMDSLSLLTRKTRVSDMANGVMAKGLHG